MIGIKQRYIMFYLENPKNNNELVVSFYRNNKLTYETVSESDILPIDSYETIKERNNKINRILK
jgi:hypothetical protein